MSKPKPPQSPWGPATGAGAQSSGPPYIAEDISPASGPQPIASPLRIEDVSPFIEPLEPPVYGASSDSDGLLCDSCSRCWKMSVGGQFKNRKADGSQFLLTERFCVFKDSLVSLAERNVTECSRFKPLKKKEKGQP